LEKIFTSNNKPEIGNEKLFNFKVSDEISHESTNVINCSKLDLSTSLTSNMRNLICDERDTNTITSFNMELNLQESDLVKFASSIIISTLPLLTLKITPMAYNSPPIFSFSPKLLDDENNRIIRSCPTYFPLFNRDFSNIEIHFSKESENEFLQKSRFNNLDAQVLPNQNLIFGDRINYSQISAYPGYRGIVCCLTFISILKIIL
jgi:hypothetical protein